MYPRLFKTLIFTMLMIHNSWAQGPSLSWSGNLYKKSYEYKRLHKQFSKQVCSGGADQKYYKFLRNYRGSGFYLPLLGNDIDRAAIKSNLSHFKKKVSFIQKTEKRLKKLEKLPSFDEVARKVKISCRLTAPGIWPAA